MRATACPIAMNGWLIVRLVVRPIVIGLRRKRRAYGEAANETSYGAGGNSTAITTRSRGSRRR